MVDRKILGQSFCLFFFFFFFFGLFRREISYGKWMSYGLGFPHVTLIFKSP